MNRLPGYKTGDTIYESASIIVSGGCRSESNEALLDRQHYKIIEGGPQGQVMFSHRFSVTFMPASQLSRHVYYSHYFFWAGEVRETSAWPVLKKNSDQFATGQWGGVTNLPI